MWPASAPFPRRWIQHPQQKLIVSPTRGQGARALQSQAKERAGRGEKKTHRGFYSRIREGQGELTLGSDRADNGEDSNGGEHNVRERRGVTGKKEEASEVVEKEREKLNQKSG